MTGPGRVMANSDTEDGRVTVPVRSATVGDRSEVVEVALLDRSGVIVSVNDAWTAFSAANGGDPGRTGVGMSYLQVCAQAPDDPFARRVASAVRTALGGGLPAPVQVQLPCHAPERPGWFDVLVSSRFDDDGECLGATVTLSPVVESRAPFMPVGDGTLGQAEPAFYAAPSERLTDVFAQLVLEQAPLAILVVDDDGWVVRAGRAAEQLFGHGPDGLTGQPVHRLLPDLDASLYLEEAVVPRRPGPRPTLLTDALLADGSAEQVEVRVGQLPLSRGTGALLLVRVASPDTVVPLPDEVVFHRQELDEVLRGLDVVVRHLFNSGLTLSGAAAARRSDRPLTTTLMGIIEDLDRAAREVRSVGHQVDQRGRRPPYVRASEPDGPGD